MQIKSEYMHALTYVIVRTNTIPFLSAGHYVYSRYHNLWKTSKQDF